MSRLQSIENALSAINEAVFQELCDHYLSLKNSNYILLSRIGSQTGKQKTVKGTPDTLLLLSSGKYLLIEYSTNKTSGSKKLKEDIEKCLDQGKSTIQIDSIAEIIICVNFNLSRLQIDDLLELVSNTFIRLSFYTLDSLSIDLHFNHRDLVHEYLNLPLDTGQIVSIERFIKEYDRAFNNIATPLDNVFLHRENELQNLKKTLIASDFIILTGPPGIGKTKLAIEAIRSFIQDNLTYNAYCVSYKNFELLNDLYQYLKLDEDYILFVDDANRIDAFSQITGFYKAERTGNLKIIITVRDYAYQEVGRLCNEFLPTRIDLEKLDDDQIIDIIKSESFKILNGLYQKEIVRIADGNPRLAIMAALLSRKYENLSALRDVSDLFDKYFGTFVKDTNDFGKDINLKILGLIAFFYTLPYKDRTLITPILNVFHLNYHDFIDSIDRLDKLELVEIQFEHVKIPEQNLAIYFFYRAFLKEELLSFETLLFEYYQTNKNRFRECVISALNTFNNNLILSRAKPRLLKYWGEIKDDRDSAMSMLNTFWYFMPTETLEFIYYLITKYPVYQTVDYKFDDNSNDSNFQDKDEIIELLSDFYRTGYELKQALELGLEYVKREPHLASGFIKTLKEVFSFKHSDSPIDFFRQEVLVDLLINGLTKGNNLYGQVLFELSKTLLKFKFQYSEGGRNMLIHIYNFSMPLNSSTKVIRAKIWEAMDNYFDEYGDEVLDALTNYSLVSPDVIKSLMKFDVNFIVRIINKHLRPSSFAHCKYVQDQIRWFKRNKISDPEFEILKKKFRNEIYEAYLILEWDRYRDREMFEFVDFRKYEQLKEAEIRSSFVLYSIESVKKFYKTFVLLKENAKNDWSYNNSLEFVVDENFKQNFNIGIELLKEIIDENNSINYVPRRVFKNNLINQDNAEAIYNLITSKGFIHQEQWLLSYFDFLDESLITISHNEIILSVIKNLEVSLTLYLDGFVKYVQLDSLFFQKILQEIYLKNLDKVVQIRLWMDFFMENFDRIGNDIDLIEKSYLQQERLQNLHFDFDLKGLKKILAKDPTFIIQYINNVEDSDLRSYSRENRNLAFIWELDDAQNYITRLFDDFVSRKGYYGFGETFLNSFFYDVNKDDREKTNQFLMKYLMSNPFDTKKVNLIVNIVRHSRKDLFDTVLLQYIKLNQNVNDFEAIWWRGNGGVYSGNVIMGDIEAADWRNILDVINRSDLGIELLPIKKHVIAKIENSLEHGDWERKRRFLERH